MFRIKICGITRPHDAQLAVRYGADAVGLNFSALSKRQVSRDQAQEIAEATPEPGQVCGVFVNATAEEIDETAKSVGLHMVQLHGDEPPELAAELSRRWPVIKAFRQVKDGLADIVDYGRQVAELGGELAMVLVDSHVPGQYGGTGRVANWDELALSARQGVLPLPLVVAGGLTHENVEEAIRVVEPTGVDVATGVETSPGVKDSMLMEVFILRAKEAFLQLPRRAM